MGSISTATYPKAMGFGIDELVLIVVSVGALLVVGVSGCIAPPGAAIDGYASAQVETWYDLDGDGEKDPNENPFPWVTIQMAYEQSITNSSGRGTVGVFKPGCARRCWKSESVSVVVPLGYQATTSTKVDLTGPENTYAFGFRPKEVAELPTFPNGPDWAWAFVNRGMDLVDLNYDADENRLSLAFDTGNGLNQAVPYGDMFDVIRALGEIEEVWVERVEITHLPSGPVVVCDMTEVQAWIGKISPAEIVSAYCQASAPSTISTTTQTN